MWLSREWKAENDFTTKNTEHTKEMKKWEYGFGNECCWGISRGWTRMKRRQENAELRMGNAEVGHLQFGLLTPVSCFQFAVSRLPSHVCQLTIFSHDFLLSKWIMGKMNG